MFKLAFPRRSRSPFKGRDMVIATMHGKDMVIGPVFEKKLGVYTVPATRLQYR
jgi:hypothetical protein